MELMAIYLADDPSCTLIELLHIPLSYGGEAGKLCLVNDASELPDQRLLEASVSEYLAHRGTAQLRDGEAKFIPKVAPECTHELLVEGLTTALLHELVCES